MCGKRKFLDRNSHLAYCAVVRVKSVQYATLLHPTNWKCSSGFREDEDWPRVWKDAKGKVLADGDGVTLITNLKIKGSSFVVKIGTKVRNIWLKKV